MPSFSQRTLYLSLSAIVLVFLTALTLIPRPNLDTLSIPSPFAQSQDQSPRPCSHLPQQQGPPSHHDQQQQQEQQPTWLLATISAYPSQRRRNIIRATWQTLYPNLAFDTRFVIAKPSPLWQPLIKHENDTYGDLIVLENLEESAKVANTLKSVEFLKLVVDHSEALGAHHAPWQFVSKIDDDSFLDAERFYKEFIVPRLRPMQRSAAPTTTDETNHNHNESNNGTLIARRLVRPDRPFSTPGGQFYTLSFDLVRLIASTHAANPIADIAEDVLIGRLLYEAKADFDFVELDDTRAFDVSEDGRGRLSKGDNVEVGPMDERAVNPHKMKDDEMYLRVAGLFGVEGFVGGDG